MGIEDFLGAVDDSSTFNLCAVMAGRYRSGCKGKGRRAGAACGNVNVTRGEGRGDTWRNLVHGEGNVGGIAGRLNAD